MADASSSQRTRQLGERDERMAKIAAEHDFIVGPKFECADGQMLGRVLAEVGWPRFRTDRMYAVAGDDSNVPLRRLQRKYHAALAAFDSEFERGRQAGIQEAMERLRP